MLKKQIKITIFYLLFFILIICSFFITLLYEKQVKPINLENLISTNQYFDNKTLMNENINDNKNQHETMKTVFVQPSFVNDKLNLSNFNYEGKCREAFKYKPHNKRDLVFTAIKYDDKKKWKHHKSQILLSMSIMNNTIPKATKVLVVYSEIDEIKTTAENFGFEVITVKVDKKRKKIGYLNAAIDRYLQLETYLNQHEGEFDRIAVIDARDVYFFADGFQTVSENEVVFTEECDIRPNGEIVCIDFQGGCNYDWVKQFYGKREANKYKKEKKHVNNVGVIMGGIIPFKQFLNVLLKEIKKMKKYLRYWGIDNAMLNHLRYSGKLYAINYTVNNYTQRLAFQWGGGYVYDAEKKSVTDSFDGCSPIIRHKLGGNTMFRLGVDIQGK